MEHEANKCIPLASGTRTHQNKTFYPVTPPPILIMKYTCLFLSLFMFHSECFSNTHVFTLLFNKSHLCNVSCGSQLLHQEFLCVFRQSVMFKKRIINQNKKKSLNILMCLNQLPKLAHKGVSQSDN